MAFITLILSGFIWIISGGLLTFSLMSIGNRSTVFIDLIQLDIPVLDYNLKGYTLLLVFFLSLIGFIGLNEYMKK